MATDDARTAVPERLREARQYLGFSVDQVARAMSYAPVLIEGMEDGSIKPTDGALFRLGRLYARPVAWLCGETTFQPDPELLREVERLTPGDREAVLDFREWLEGAGPAPKISRKLLGEDG